MPSLLADANVEGHLDAIVRFCTSSDWRLLWVAADVRIVRFSDLHLLSNIPDDELWRVCQSRGIVLITGNRNSDGADSLEATIRLEAKAESLPVLTLADPDRVMRDRSYLELIAVRLMDVLFDIESVRGAGRVYLP